MFLRRKYWIAKKKVCRTFWTDSILTHIGEQIGTIEGKNVFGLSFLRMLVSRTNGTPRFGQLPGDADVFVPLSPFLLGPGVSLPGPRLLHTIFGHTYHIEQASLIGYLSE